jgi:hypothetical protein
MTNKVSSSLVLLAALACGFPHAHAQSSEPLQSVIESKLNGIAASWPKKDAKTVVEQVYTEQTQITGEGVAELYQGKAQLTGLVQHLMAGSRSTVIHLNRLVQLNDESAYTWVTWDVTPAGNEEQLSTAGRCVSAVLVHK